MQTAVGVLAIGDVSIVDEAAITPEEARLSGFASAECLRTELAERTAGAVYRIEVRYAGPDSRVALRADDRLDDDALRSLSARLQRLDGASPWTVRAIALIGQNPGMPAVELSRMLGLDKARFKTDVRRLKALGLTESLKIGYRLSPRGVALRSHFDRTRI